ncbi:MAG TPA: hypothetical protein VM266_05810, partial [Solirubrobacteraceae bacterium]|nr:hypothetical protein [Solirubrobacteraceae bacterium]
MRRPLVALAATVALGLTLAPAPAAAPSGATRECGGDSEAVLKKGRWTLIAKPQGLTRILSHAEAAGGRRLLVTDGTRIARSTDGGCSWNVVYEVAGPTGEGTAADGLLPRVSRLATLPGSDVALATVEGVGRAAASRLLRSTDGGGEGSWRQVEGPPAVTGIREVIAAPDSAERVYLVTGTADAVGENDPSGANGLLYRSDDRGETWTSLGVNGEVEKLAVEPDTDGRHLWIVRSNGTVLHSRDAGATFEAQTLPGPQDEEGAPLAAGDHWRDVAVHRFVHIAHAVVVTASPTRAADVTRAVYSPDRGATWLEVPVDQLGPAGGLVFGNDGSQLYSAGGSAATSWRGPGLVEFDGSAGRWRSADDLNLVSLLDPRRVQSPRPDAPGYHAIYLRSHRGGEDAPPDALARFEPPTQPSPPQPLLGRPDCGDPSAPPQKRKPVTFEPARLDVQLTPGQPARVPVRASLASDPAPVDVAFLVDNSSSMDPAIGGLFCSIERLVRELPERHLDAHFGLAAYNDIASFTYRRLVDVAPPETAGPAISAALRLLFTMIGREEPLRGALYQLATGAGLDAPAPSAGVHRRVPPGQEINFRAAGKSLRTVFVITDEPYEDTTEGEPPLEDVFAALQSRGIRVIGLPVRTDAPPTDTQHALPRQLVMVRQLQEIARGSGALAPRGGVDCDGGGSPDVQTGEPIVCPIDERGIRRELDDTLVSILTSLAGEDRKPVRLVPRRTDGLDAGVEGDPVELDLRQDNQLDATAVLSCTEEQAGRSFDVAYDVVAGDDRVLDTISGVARCGALAPAARPPGPNRAAGPEADPRPASREPAPAPAEPAAPPAAPAPVQ